MRLAGRCAVIGALFLAGSGLSAREPWLTLPACRQVRNESNDGDSFHVNAAGRKYIFRLYFVDAPETETSFEGRVEEQAKYFSITNEQALELGREASRFTNGRLTRPFTVRTSMHEAQGRSKKPRYYAFVETTEGDLAELLIANGLARLHGTEAKPEGLRSPGRQWDKLERLEREAKQQKVGGWGAPFGRMTARIPKQPPKTGPESFDAFFHPERVAAPAEADAILESAEAATATSASSGGKLDPNTATSEELLAIPGIGAVLAGRIIAARPFASPNDLQNVQGIGAKKYETIRSHFAD